MADDPTQLDTSWRPEEWTHGRFLVVRHVQHSPGIIKRELHCTTRFGGIANIYESEETAQAAADQLNLAGETSIKETEQ